MTRAQLQAGSTARRRHRQCGRARRSTCRRVGDDVYHTYSTFGRGIEEFHYGIPYLDLTALGRQEPWEQPKRRATPLGLHSGGPRLRFPDEYDS